MVLNLVLLDGSEGAKPDVQRDKADLHAHRRNLFKQLRCEMKSRSRRGGAAKLLRVHGLVSLGILQLRLYIRRKRHLAEAFEHLKEDPLIFKSDYPVAALADVLDNRSQLALTEQKLCPRLCLAAGSAETFPSVLS